jgi:hypothetical protein
MKTILTWFKWIVMAAVVVAATAAWLYALGFFFDVGLTLMVIPIKAYFFGG